MIWALEGVSFEIEAGEAVGIIGRNGAGKTTLLKILSRITSPTRGDVDMYGRVGALLEVGTGFHGELTGRENIYFSGAVLGMTRAEIRDRFDAIVSFAEVERFLDTPVKRYSTGMYLRLAFSVAAHLEPEILLVDEVLAVGDVNFQRKCLDKMEEVGKAGRTVLFVSHNVPSVIRLCDRVILLEGGAVVADGRPQEVVARYLSPATGTPAERVWLDLDNAPGNGVARMRAVRVLNEFYSITEAVDVGDPLVLEIEYWQLQRSGPPVAAFQLFNEDGTCLFASSAFQDPTESEDTVCPSLVRARCRVPAHLLAEGRVFMLAAVVSYNPDRVHALERDAVSFQVVDRRGADVVRKYYAGRWPGVIRPTLDWDVKVEDWP
jgi:lipopolysaccharide transport system ATP-binding protein